MKRRLDSDELISPAKICKLTSSLCSIAILEKMRELQPKISSSIEEMSLDGSTPDGLVFLETEPSSPKDPLELSPQVQEIAKTPDAAAVEDSTCSSSFPCSACSTRHA